MCGIVGAVSNIAGDDIAPHILKGLSILEYRGYDSAGLAVSTSHGIRCVKVVGKIKALEAEALAHQVAGRVGIGHTRWATHGEPSVQNAHPIENSHLFLVHNGIIENYAAIKQMLQAKGHKFKGDTDTEVIAALIKDHLDDGQKALDAVRSAVNQCHGSYAILVMLKSAPEQIIGYRHGAPLLLGISEDRHYFGSDAGMLAEFVLQVVDLDDGELAVITAGSDYAVYDANTGAKVTRQGRSVSKMDAASKGQYAHYMLKEIHEQEDVVLKCLSKSYDAHTRTIFPELDDINWEKVSKIRLLACGTSRIAAEVAKHWLEKYTKVAAEVEIASEFRYRTPVIHNDELFVFISQSGETADTLAALKYVRQIAPKNKTLAIVNAVGSTIARGVNHIIPIHAGVEIGVASTKAFTATLTVFILLAFKIAAAKGLMSASEVKKRIDILHNFASHIQNALSLELHISAFCSEIDVDKILYIGRALSHPLAMEGALKMKELSYIPSEGVAAGELKHGPIALVDERTLIVAIAPYDELFLKTAANIQEVVARKGKVLLLSNEKGAEELRSVCHDVLILPESNDFTMALLYAIPLQLLAYYTALHRGNDVDQPRNLAKSVTVE
ncbi:MAG: glutamine--fructose-6-phosphate transaminase (isomerizing) [Proteobacteria bacterium]|nr:glutamine--fructose-6-phosphate transaminase (isomerizing) [Pseudomonadota bacterium]